MVIREEESPQDTVELYCAIGGTIIQASLKASRVQRGVFGSIKSAQNPITISLKGSENLKGEEVNQEYTICKFIRSQVLRILGDEFRELRPEQDSFPTLSITLRLLMDDGNHVQAYLLAGLTAFYLYVRNLQDDEEVRGSRPLDEVDYYFPLCVTLLNQECRSMFTVDILCDPTWQEEQISKNWILFMQRIDSGSYCVYKPGGETVPLDLIDNLKKVNENKRDELYKLKAFIDDKQMKNVSLF